MRPAIRRGYHRSSESGLEFERAAFFSDAVFAIAMTLLVIPVIDAMPHVADNSSISTMWHALDGVWPSILAFFIGFFVIGRYWVAHHAFFGLLTKIDRGFLSISLVFLAVIAFLPFPTFLVGHDESNPLSIVIYSGALLLASLSELWLIWYAHRSEMLESAITPPVYRYYLLSGAAPLFGFVVAIPVAFVDTSAGLLCYLLSWPITALIDRRHPDEDAALDAGEAADP